MVVCCNRKLKLTKNLNKTKISLKLSEIGLKISEYNIKISDFAPDGIKINILLYCKNKQITLNF